ncbi:MAG TPA: folate-binding protein [Acetobacteraceae bacterium]|nr:folate-binding protein [Acetobacteraceae bacterium]
MTHLAYLPRLGVIAVSGADRVSFLNGLLSNDVAVAPGRAIFAALLTAQGRYRSDFIVFADPDRLLLVTRRDEIASILPLLRRYRLRAQVELADVSDSFAVHAGWGGTVETAERHEPDPRLAAGLLACTATASAYDSHRLALGLPDGPPDLEPEKTLLMEAGFDELAGISWTKGCYMGQELTARTRYRGLVKRRLVPVTLAGPLPALGTLIHAGEREVGDIRSGRDHLALAMVRVDSLRLGLHAGDIAVKPHIPHWMRLPEPA